MKTEKVQWSVLIVKAVAGWNPGACDSMPREIAGATIHARKLGRDEANRAARVFNLAKLQRREQKKDFNGEWALVAFAPTRHG